MARKRRTPDETNGAATPACSLKRYDPVQYHDQGGRSYGHMRAEPDGDFVEYVEAQGLERENERLRAEMEAAYQLLIKRRPIDAEQHLRVVLTSLPNTEYHNGTNPECPICWSQQAAAGPSELRASAGSAPSRVDAVWTLLLRGGLKFNKEAMQVYDIVKTMERENDSLRAALRCIADFAGTTEDECGVTCGASWCAEQARSALWPNK